ncbi:MAG: hypothetical protein ACMXYE_01575 [Candidatus Woesearchaeota archaeon]
MDSQNNQEELMNQVTRACEHPSVADVAFKQFLVSKNPVLCKKLGNGVCVVLFKEKQAAISHFDHIEGNPEEYIPRMIKALHSAQESSSVIEAVLIGGDSDHIAKCAFMLEKNNIKTIGHYCDNWRDDFVCDAESHLEKLKDIAIIPEEKTIILFSTASDFVKVV